MLEDYFEEEEEEQQQEALAEVAITNNGWRSQPNCSAICVFFAAKDRAQCTSAQDVTCTCACCLVSQNITQK
jgi:hypothetical protein